MKETTFLNLIKSLNKLSSKGLEYDSKLSNVFGNDSIIVSDWYDYYFDEVLMTISNDMNIVYNELSDWYWEEVSYSNIIDIDIRIKEFYKYLNNKIPLDIEEKIKKIIKEKLKTDIISHYFMYEIYYDILEVLKTNKYDIDVTLKNNNIYINNRIIEMDMI